MAKKHFLVEVDMHSNNVVNLNDPTDDQDAATRKYVDTEITTISLTPGPKGDKGAAATATAGDTTEGSALVTNVGTTHAAVFDFRVPRGATGSPGSDAVAPVVTVDSTVTLAPGLSAKVTDVEEGKDVKLKFEIPRGNTGLTGGVGGIGPMPEHQWSSYSLRFETSVGTWGGYTNLRGATGATGPAGPTSVSTDANNLASLGTDSKIYVSKTHTHAYLPLAGGEMVSTATISFDDQYINEISSNGHEWSNPGLQTRIGPTGVTTSGANKAIAWSGPGYVGIGDVAEFGIALKVHGEGKFTDTLYSAEEISNPRFRLIQDGTVNAQLALLPGAGGGGYIYTHSDRPMYLGTGSGYVNRKVVINALKTEFVTPIAGTSAKFTGTVETNATADYVGFLQKYNGISTVVLRQYGNKGMLEVRKDTTNVSMKVTSDGTGINAQPLAGYQLYVDGLTRVKNSSSLGTTLGNHKLVGVEKAISGNSNIMYLRQWAVRNANGSDWASVNIREGISVDASYGTPTTSKAWWDRDPQDGKHIFGDASNSNFTMFSDGSIQSRGIAGIAGSRESGFALKVHGRMKTTKGLSIGQRSTIDNDAGGIWTEGLDNDDFVDQNGWRARHYGITPIKSDGSVDGLRGSGTEYHALAYGSYGGHDFYAQGSRRFRVNIEGIKVYGKGKFTGDVYVDNDAYKELGVKRAAMKCYISASGDNGIIGANNGTNSSILYLNAANGLGVGGTAEAGFAIRVHGKGKFSGDVNIAGVGSILEIKHGVNTPNHLEVVTKFKSDRDDYYAQFATYRDALSYDIGMALGSPQVPMSITYRGAGLAVGIGGLFEKNTALKVHGQIKATDFVLSSDIRLKEHAVDLDPRRLRPVSFDWKDGRGHDIGFIAQEVEEFYPEVVLTAEDGMKSLSYSKITAINAARINELEEENDSLKARIERLEMLINNLL